MDLNELQRATEWHLKLKGATAHRNALAEYRVVGIVVDRGEGGLNPVRIERGGNSGSGSITSLGWTKDLQDAMTNALHQLLEEREEAARAALTDLGVKLDAA